MKNSTSSTSLSSIDKDYSFLTQNGRASATHRPSLPTYTHSTCVEQEYQIDEYTKQKRQNAVPSLTHTKRRRRRDLITANLSGTRYEVVRQMVEKVGFSVIKEDDPTAYLIWNDCFVSQDKISELKPYQRINHFPGMGEVTRKDALARNYIKMQKTIPDEFDFMPKTWILPADYSILLNHAKEMKQRKKFKTYIVKPSNGAQGHGISLFRNAEKIPPTEHFIVQEYIDKPLLLDGYKFDLRIYVLITSCDPLRIFLFNDGLVRLATEKYLPPHESNINHLFMHLTNYSVNKHNEYYEKNIAFDTGSKRSIRYFNEYLRRSDIDVSLLWRNIGDMIVRTLLVAEPHILHAYRMCRPGLLSGSDSVCFEVLGFDIMIDQKLRPWLLEINRSPSFGTDERIDFEIKSTLIEDTFRLLNIKVSDKRRKIAAQKAEAQKRLFRSNRKVDGHDITDMDKRKVNNEKRKEELKEILSRIRKIASREDFENRNCGQFRRIFPSDDRARQDRYCKILTNCFTVFLAGRGASMQKDIQVNYNNKYREDDLLDMIAECEVDEKYIMFCHGSRFSKAPKPLQSMPESLAAPEEEEDMDDDDDESDTSAPNSPQWHRPSSPTLRPHSGNSGGSSMPVSHQTSQAKTNSPNQFAVTSSGGGRPRTLSRAVTTNKLITLQRSNVDDVLLTSIVKEREEELTKKALLSLMEMRIKFPGKSDTEAEIMLDLLTENWKFHKPRIASYWLVKLDSIKRRKVIDIVRSNVRAMLQRTCHISDIDNLRLHHIFSRVFNRLLWSNGQGLWNCFSATSSKSWETIFTKSSENMSEVEINCCRRIVQLCKDCLLIVYKFADESKNPGDQTPGEQTELTPFQTHSQSGYLTCRDMRPSVNWSPHTTYSQRYSKLYNNHQSSTTNS